jgi:hypothetical protein
LKVWEGHCKLQIVWYFSLKSIKEIEKILIFFFNW